MARIRRLMLPAFLLAAAACGRETGPGTETVQEQADTLRFAAVDTVRLVDTVQIVDTVGFPVRSDEQLGAVVVEHPERGTLVCLPSR